MSQPTPNKPNRPPVPPQVPSRFGRSLMGWVIIIGLALLLMALLGGGLDRARDISPQEFWKHARNGKIAGAVIVKEREIRGTLAENVAGLDPDETRDFRVKYSYTVEDSFDERLSAALDEGMANGGENTTYRYEFSGWWEGLLPQLLLLLVVFLVVWFFLFRRLGAAAGGGGILGNFGRSRHKVSTKEHTNVTFDDVAGIEEAKDEVNEVIEFLKNPRKFQRLGGRIPRGVLLVGAPGCGKTLLAKAIAGEADVPFFSISGSDFVEMFVGVGASRVRDLFKQAKESSPCIIFLDEIDAVGRRRGMGFNGGGHDEREQTLNAILVEMDGFDSSDQVIVIAATNRMDVLDPALTRPGRFDRQINVPLPDLRGRYDILKIYAAKVTCGQDVDLHRLARGTPMFSGADLAALVNEAAIAATMVNKEAVEQADLEEARDKVRWGRARKNRVVDEKEKEITAYHEAGHALTQLLTPGADPLHKVTILARGEMGGATFSLPEKDRHLYTRSYCQAMLCVFLGGRQAEEIFCHDVSSGAAADIAQATEIARKMVLDWGMSDQLGFVRYSNDQASMPFGDQKEYSQQTAEVIDREVKAIIDQAYQASRKLLLDNRETLERIAQAVLRYETLNADEVDQIVQGKKLDKPTVGDLLMREEAKAADAEEDSAGAEATPPVADPPVGPIPEPG